MIVTGKISRSNTAHNSACSFQMRVAKGNWRSMADVHTEPSFYSACTLCWHLGSPIGCVPNRGTAFMPAMILSIFAGLGEIMAVLALYRSLDEMCCKTVECLLWWGLSLLIKDNRGRDTRGMRVSCDEGWIWYTISCIIISLSLQWFSMSCKLSETWSKIKWKLLCDRRCNSSTMTKLCEEISSFTSLIDENTEHTLSIPLNSALKLCKIDPICIALRDVMVTDFWIQDTKNVSLHLHVVTLIPSSTAGSYV